MRILLISSNSSGTGGGEQYLVYLAQGLAALGEEPVVLLSATRYMDVWETRFKIAGIRVIRENLTGLRDRPLRLLQSIHDSKQIRLISSICERIKPDVIHVNQQYDADALDYLMGAIEYGRVPVIGTIHMPMTTTKHPRSFMNIRTWLIALSGADRFKTGALRGWYKKYPYEKIFPSRTMSDEFAAVYGQAEHLHTLYPGIDVARIPRGETSGDRKVFGFCGRLEPQKAPLLFVDAWLTTLRSTAPSRMVIIGDGSMRKVIEEKLKRFAPSGSWRITEWVEDPLAHLKGIDVLVMSSRFEGWGMVAVEAACMGKQCVVTPTSVAHELQEKIPWLVIARSHTAANLAESMAMAVSSPSPDPGAVRAVRDFFSCERMARETLALYRNESL